MKIAKPKHPPIVRERGRLGVQRRIAQERVPELRPANPRLFPFTPAYHHARMTRRPRLRRSFALPTLAFSHSPLRIITPGWGQSCKATRADTETQSRRLPPIDMDNAREMKPSGFPRRRRIIRPPR
jgi:hypothetical protein